MKSLIGFCMTLVYLRTRIGKVFLYLGSCRRLSDSEGLSVCFQQLSWAPVLLGFSMAMCHIGSIN